MDVSHVLRVARPEGLEPPTTGFEVRCSIQLSYGRAIGITRQRHRLSLSAGRVQSSAIGAGVHVEFTEVHGEAIHDKRETGCRFRATEV